MHESSSPMRGISLLEVLIALTLLVLAAMMGVMHVLRASQHLDWVEDKGFAREKAVSILAELRSHVEGEGNGVAADLDGFDNGVSQSPILTIASDPFRPGEFVPPDHPTSGNSAQGDSWRYWRRITVRPYGSEMSRDVRFVTVRIFRTHPGEEMPGTELAQVSSLIRTVGDSYPSTQVYDLYLLALENAPGWWVHMDVIQPFVEAILTDLQGRNRGLQFRTHWITKLGFGRDEEYAPYTNEFRASTDLTPWTYVYPGRLPDGESALRYYVPGRMKARVNVDGITTANFLGEYVAQEPWNDVDGDGRYDTGESFLDQNGDGSWDPGNTAPYAFADMHNHCMRWPEAERRLQERVAAGLDSADTPTWRLLLDSMVTDPESYHNAILVNLHGELLPMPPARNYSDAAKDPAAHPGFRVVTHPERIRPRRVEGDDVLSETPRFRVYAWKTVFDTTEAILPQTEPYYDVNANGVFDPGESHKDWNGNGVWDAGTPISIVVQGGDFSAMPNDVSTPTLRVLRLPGGVDTNWDGIAEPYADWEDAPRYPEDFTDVNGDGRHQIAEAYLDLNGNGARDAFEPWTELDGDGAHTASAEALVDANGNGRHDSDQPAESFTDANGNGRWDGAEPWWDLDGDGAWTPPTAPKSPWIAWDPSNYANLVATELYIAGYGEPFLDLDGDKEHDPAESLTDLNGNGVHDGGFEYGEMWFSVAATTSPLQTVIHLHGTPLETPYDSSTQRGLPPTARLYDLEYIPCPTPEMATATDRFALDLYSADERAPKNTARWILELPLPAVRTAFETGTGNGDGDAEDRILTLETRLGRDPATGVMWPVRHDPQNLSVTHAWFYADVEDVPFSERYQFQGDPRHCPYADTDATGQTAIHGYNWYFDDFEGATGNAASLWPAFDANRLGDGWMGRGSGSDVPRLLSWLRTALVRSESVYTTLTGFSYYYMSLGGDVGYDSANGFANSIPMDGLPFGLTGSVYENTITDGGGTTELKGSRKFVRSNDGTADDARSGGYWWSKPWLGELFPDSAYASQWVPCGNLRANTGTSAGTYRLLRRGDVTQKQQPEGTTLVNLGARLLSEGCTTLFHIGTTTSTFHHQSASGTGILVDQGVGLASNYNLDVPDPAPISRPFGLTASGTGGVGPEFGYTDAYPRHSANLVAQYYDHSTGAIGSGLVRLNGPGTGASSAYIVVNGLDRTLETGSAHIARYSVISLLHSFFAAGGEGLPNRIRQLPRVEVLSPTLTTELRNPAQIVVRWSTHWTRWDGRPYTPNHPSDFAEDESEIRYVLLYSADGGNVWQNMLDDSVAEPGLMRRTAASLPDPARTLPDMAPGSDEGWVWNVPPAQFPQGSYLIRIEAHRASEPLHHAHHVEKIHVTR